MHILKRKKLGLLLMLLLTFLIGGALSACSGGGEDLDKTPHTHILNPEDGDCTTPIACSICGEVINVAQKSHTSASDWSKDDSRHWQPCVNEGCSKLAIEKADHVYTDSNVCECAYIDVANLVIEGTTLKKCYPWELTKITIPADVTEIADGVFAKCEKVTDITFLGDVTIIGKKAFDGCMRLQNISGLTGIVSIGEYAFSNCHKLTEITLSDTIAAIGKGVFSNCSSLIEISIPDSITSIPDSMFYACGELSTVQFPDTVLQIGNDAFSKCKKLVDIQLPKSLKNIGNNAFADCKSLTSVMVPQNVATIGERAFADCTLLQKAVLPDGLTELSKYMFYGCSVLKQVEIPSSLKTIQESAFSGCLFLDTISIPDGMIEIGIAVFNGCSSLTEITLPASVTTVKESAFSGCYALTIKANASAKPSGWTDGWNTFDSKDKQCPVVWSAATNTVANDGWTYTVENRIRYATNATTKKAVRQPKSLMGEIVVDVPIIDYDSFMECNYITKITIGLTVNAINSGAFFGCSSVSSLDVVTGNSKFYAQNNCIIDRTSKTLMIGCSSSVIPADGSVTSLGDYAFAGSALTLITIPSSVNRIGFGAFSNCMGLTKIIIPEGVTKLDQSVFQNCLNLSEVSLPNSLVAIGSRAFYGCRKLAKIVIPKNVADMGSWVFADWKEGLMTIKIYVEAKEDDEIISYGWSILWNDKTEAKHSPKYDDVIWGSMHDN